LTKKILFVFALTITAAVLLTITGTYLAINPALLNLGQTPEGTLYWPRGVAVNSTGNIFVADTQNSRGQIFNADGSFNSTFAFPGNNEADASLNQPFGIFINSTNFVYVADTFTNVVKVYDPNGSYLKTIGTAGTGVDEYYYPSGVTQNSTHIFIADTFNNRIIITDLSGNTEDTIP